MKTLIFFNFLTVCGLLLTINSFGQTPSKNKANCMAFYEAFNSRDLNKIQSLVTDNFVDHAIAPEMAQQSGLSGKPLFMASLQELLNGFPDVRIEPIQYVAEGDVVMIYLTMSGTQNGEFADMPATGKPFMVHDADMVKFDKNGKATEHWAVQDGSAMMMQLGVNPMEKN